MKSPKSVRISGVEYAIQTVDVLTDGVHELAGEIKYSERVIRISRNSCHSHDYQCMVLLHEITHGIFEDRGITLDEDVEETVCEAVARGMFQLLQDNADRLFDLWTGEYAGYISTRGNGGRGHGGSNIFLTGYPTDDRENENDDDKERSER